MANAKRFSLVYIAALVVAFSAFFCLRNRQELSFSFSKTVELDTPYLIRDNFSFRYILDKQRTRILVVDKATNTVQTVCPRQEKGADVFYYADEFMFDERGFMYVKEGAWNGNCISREAVLFYDASGHYCNTVLDTHYGDLVNKHKIHLLSVRGGKLHYAVKEKHCVVISSYDLEKNTERKKIIPFEDAFDFISDMTEDSAGNVYLLAKTGAFFMLNEEKSAFTLVYRAKKEEFPYWIEASDSKKLFYTDLYADSVMSLDVQKGETSLVLADCGSVTVTPVPFSSLQNPLKNAAMLHKQVALHCAFILGLVCMAFLFVCAVIFFFKRKMHVIQRISFYILIIVIVVSSTITYKLTNEFSKVMRMQILSQMENMAHSVANTIDPHAVDSIECAADFASSSYRQMLASMESIIDCRMDVNRSVYCDILKYDERHGAYACAYLDQAIGTYFPIPENEADEVRQIYQTGQTMHSSMDEYSGSFTYVSVPVFAEDGRVCGVVAVLTETYMLTDQINAMKKNVLLGIVITLIFIWLLMGEGLSYILAKSKAQMDAQERLARGEAVQKVFPHYYIRLMVFALFAAYNLTTTFLPMVITKGAFESLGSGCSPFVVALPISVNLFVIGVMALFCESLIRKCGLRNIIVIGTALSALSNLIVFMFPLSFLMLFLALVIDGIGVGLSTNAMYLMVSQIPEAKNRTSGYAAYNAAQVSGINFGMLFGAALALNIGRRMIFPLVSLMWLVAALLFVLLWRSLGIAEKKAREASDEAPKTRFTPRRIISFLCHRRIWSYMLFVQAPFALMGSFVYYYLPLYSEDHALSEVVVAVLMMLYSMFAIYLGNGLTRWVVRRMRDFSPYASIILSAAAVVIYAVNGTFAGLLAAILLLGLANGFGHSVQQAHFSLLEECDEFGVPDAMGIYNFTEFIGQSFGPAVMGLVFLSRNMLTTTVLFATLLVCLCVFHFVTTVTKKTTQ